MLELRKEHNRNLAGRLLDGIRWFIPPKCWDCQQWLVREKITLQQPPQNAYPFLCKHCLKNLPWTIPEFCCTHCGQQTGEPNRKYCAECLERPFYFDQLWGGFHYDGRIQQWITQYKYGKKMHMAPLLGRLLSLSLDRYALPAEVDGVVPIPLHRKRLWERGFNQALLLGHHTFTKSSLLQPYWLQRVRLTIPQTRLSFKMRLQNMENAFQADPQVEGKHLLLLDDVMTTGATLNAATRALKERGALFVGVIVLARRMRSASLISEYQL